MSSNKHGNYKVPHDFCHFEKFSNLTFFGAWPAALLSSSIFLLDSVSAFFEQADEISVSVLKFELSLHGKIKQKQINMAIPSSKQCALAQYSNIFKKLRTLLTPPFKFHPISTGLIRYSIRMEPLSSMVYLGKNLKWGLFWVFGRENFPLLHLLLNRRAMQLKQAKLHS